jgi:hypothetical protein
MTRGLTVSEDDGAPTHDHVMVNRASWDDDAPNWVERGRTSWASDPRWGIWGVPESELGLLPDDLAGLDGERLPFRDGSFDYAVSEYGAAIWCDPYRWPRPRASFDSGAACCSSAGRRCC